MKKYLQKMTKHKKKLFFIHSIYKNKRIKSYLVKELKYNKS